ncbi:MAG: bifunctional phosphopantothenoylcysteine decarboxylase/phosphopantothenate--cysteine ligase CoaBC [Nitrospirae bacterium]|nr:bifunctional phosphopantothenoylcysteine decarboxylase/phosphopantothenate--cysteine ligase CoaBC [Nitrospirota bacterium]
MLDNRNILLGVTGSISAYKAVDIARRLIDEGFSVQAVMTKAACNFITPLTFESLTGKSVLAGLFSNPYSHINLSKESRLLLIAPATANTINKLSCGIADDLLSNLWLTYVGPTLIAPAMNHRMYRHPSVQKSIKELQKSGVKFIGPVSGSLACGEEGEGRMADVATIVEAAISALTQKDLKGQNILVTAGPTIESIDPVRFISNRSSGKMGYAIAKAALRRGAKVTLISGPTSQMPPENVSFVSVEKASEMETAVLRHLPKATAVIMAAAVADFTPAIIDKLKLRKKDISAINLKKTSDILKKVGAKKGKRVVIGFAAETGKNIENAKKKLKEKNLDLIVLNDVTQKGAGFGIDTNIVTIIDRKGKITDYPLMKKIEVANVILDRMPGMSSRKKE